MKLLFLSIVAFEFTSQCYVKWQRRDLIKPLQKKEKSNKILQISKGEDFDCVKFDEMKGHFYLDFRKSRSSL